MERRLGQQSERRTRKPARCPEISFRCPQRQRHRRFPHEFEHPRSSRRSGRQDDLRGFQADWSQHPDQDFRWRRHHHRSKRKRRPATGRWKRVNRLDRGQLVLPHCLMARRRGFLRTLRRWFRQRRKFRPTRVRRLDPNRQRLGRSNRRSSSLRKHAFRINPPENRRLPRP